MGQKVHPVGLRLGIIRTWDSRWYQEKQYAEWLHEDIKIRQAIYEKMKGAGVSTIEIERAARIHIIIHTARPGMVIGRKGTGIEEMRRILEKLTNKEIKLDVEEIKHPELDARLVAENICEQLARRVSFRRAMKQAVSRTMKAGAKGVRIECKGRLGGAEIARKEKAFDGKVPLHTLRADIDYAVQEAYTTYGRIGVKVWIYKGEILPKKKTAETSLLSVVD